MMLGAAPTVAAMPSPPCMSRHLGNAGKPRPPVAWRVTYACLPRPVRRQPDPLRRPECDAPHVEELCGPCAESLVDGRQRCARCLAPMAVSGLEQLEPATA